VLLQRGQAGAQDRTGDVVNIACHRSYAGLFRFPKPQVLDSTLSVQSMRLRARACALAGTAEE